jgi:hypothetical protein
MMKDEVVLVRAWEVVPLDGSAKSREEIRKIAPVTLADVMEYLSEVLEGCGMPPEDAKLLIRQVLGRAFFHHVLTGETLVWKAANPHGKKQEFVAYLLERLQQLVHPPNGASEYRFWYTTSGPFLITVSCFLDYASRFVFFRRGEEGGQEFGMARCDAWRFFLSLVEDYVREWEFDQALSDAHEWDKESGGVDSNRLLKEEQS